MNELVYRTCGEYRCLVFDDRAIIEKYLGPEARKVQPIDAGKRVTVPETVDGVPVKGIDTDAFKGCRQMEEIRIPEGVISIGARAFWSCSRLVTAELPKDLQFIDEEAFRGCTQLERILPETLPDLKEIGEGAFRGCTALKEVFLGKSVEKIGPRAFRGCENLTVTVAEGSAAEDWCRKNPVRYAVLAQDGRITVPDRPDIPTAKEEYRYEEKEDRTLRITGYNGKQDSFTVPEKIGGKTVTEIGDYAFRRYTKIRRLTLPDSVTRIGKQAFERHRLLEWIRFGKGLREIGDGAFSNCCLLKRIEGNFPELRRIGEQAFCGCEWLQEMPLPATLQEIGDLAFGHTRLEGITVPEGTQSVGNYAFMSCSYLKEVRLPERLQKLGDGAFRDCSKLERIEMPCNVPEIGKLLFENCTQLKEIRVSGNGRLMTTGRFLTDREEKRVIAYCAGCEDEVCVVPRGTEIIGTRVFMRAKMERLVLSEGVRIIENEAFDNCMNLKTVQLPESLRVIGEDAFGSCGHLTWLTIPDGVEEIGYGAFCNCQELNKLRIPASVKKIGGGLFGWRCQQPVCIVVTKGSYAEEHFKYYYDIEYE